MWKCHKLVTTIVLISIAMIGGCSRGPSKKQIEQMIRNHIENSQMGHFNFPTHLFPDKDYLDPKYKTQEESLKLEELKVVVIKKSEDQHLWRVKVYAKVSATLVPRPAPGASWLRAYDHYEVPTSNKKVSGEGELSYNISRDEFGDWHVSLY